MRRTKQLLRFHGRDLASREPSFQPRFNQYLIYTSIGSTEKDSHHRNRLGYHVRDSRTHIEERCTIDSKLVREFLQ